MDGFFHLMEQMGYGKITIFILRIISKFISFCKFIIDFCSRIWCFW